MSNSSYSSYNASINTISSSFFSALDDFKTNYVNVYKQPNIPDYKSAYSTNKDQLNALNNDLYTLSNTIQREITTLNTDVDNTSIALNVEKGLNVQLNNKYNNLENINNGSFTSIGDSTELYNRQYNNNIEMLVGIILICYVTYKING